MSLQIWIYSIASVIVISLMSFAGIVTLYIKSDTLNKILSYIISVAAGTLVGDAFIHLLPEVVAKHGFTLSISMYVLAGIVMSFVIEKIIHWRHCHHVTDANHPHPFVWLNLIGDSVHNFVDGLVVGAAYVVDVHVGFVTALAIVLHEIPQEIGDFCILIHGGFSKGRALFVNFLTALTAVLGTIVALLLSSAGESLTMFLVPFAAGIFIYISCADLIPELHKEENAKKSSLQLVAFVFGIALMAALILIEG